MAAHKSIITQIVPLSSANTFLRHPTRAGKLCVCHRRHQLCSETHGFVFVLIATTDPLMRLRIFRIPRGDVKKFDRKGN